MNNNKPMDNKCYQPEGACCQEAKMEDVEVEESLGEQATTTVNQDEGSVGTCGGACTCADL